VYQSIASGFRLDGRTPRPSLAEARAITAESLSDMLGGLRLRRSRRAASPIGPRAAPKFSSTALVLLLDCLFNVPDVQLGRSLLHLSGILLFRWSVPRRPPRARFKRCAEQFVVQRRGKMTGCPRRPHRRAGQSVSQPCKTARSNPERAAADQRMIDQAEQHASVPGGRLRSAPGSNSTALLHS